LLAGLHDPSVARRCYADIDVIDLSKLPDKATYTEQRYSKGMADVLIKGSSRGAERNSDWARRAVKLD
jgi:hypothetical protein